jgi:beta-lactam-binding protein with PASTA domain
VDLILDITGHEVPRVPLPPQYQNAPVLGQLPAAGTVVDPATGRLRLVLAAALEAAPVVTMPSLVGLTYDEVVKVLERLGLRVGTTTIRQTGP